MNEKRRFLDLRLLNRYSLRFKDELTEYGYQRVTKAARLVQMRASLILASSLYIIAALLDSFMIPTLQQNYMMNTHIIESIVLLSAGLLLIKSHNKRVHTFAVIILVTAAWFIHMYFTIKGGAWHYVGEAYLMIIWVWLVAGLSFSKCTKLTLSFLLTLEIALAWYQPEYQMHIVWYQYFSFMAVLIGMVGAYLSEYFRRYSYLNLKNAKERAKQLSKAYARSEKDKFELQKLTQAIEQSGEAIILLDAKEEVTYVNPMFTEITGFVQDEMRGRAHPALEKQQPSYEEIRDTLQKERIWRGDITDGKKDGTSYQASVSIAAIMAEDKQVSHYVMTIRDMTEVRRLEDIMRQKQKMESIGTLVGGIAHDFNNTLAGITGYTYLVKEEVEGLPQTLEKIEAIESLSYGSAELVKQLLAFSRKSIVSMEVVDAAELIDKVSKLSSITFPADIKFDVELDAAHDIYIYGDLNQLEQVLLNILNNARDAVNGSDQAKVSLRLEQWSSEQSLPCLLHTKAGDNYAKITITDNGEGISEDHKQLIFEPFFTTKGVNKGTGLGLSMAYGTVHTHKGCIHVESKKGVGSEFQIYLPLHQGKISSKATIESPDVIKVDTASTVLLVDDNSEVLRTVKLVLERLGYKVVEATNGAEAIEVYASRSDEISLVILDVVMASLGGIQAAREIRSINAAAKIIFLTGYEPSQYFNSQEMRQEHVLEKPFKINEFSQLVQKVVSGKQ